MNARQIRDKMENLKTYILNAETTVRAGKMVDLTNLDKDVAVMCEAAVALPPDQARDLQPVMADLIGNLENLSVALRDYRENATQK